MDSQKLAEMLAEIKERDMSIHSFLVIRNGYLVSETYFGLLDQPDAKHEHAIRRQELHVRPSSGSRSIKGTSMGLTIEW